MCTLAKSSCTKRQTDVFCHKTNVVLNRYLKNVVDPRGPITESKGFSVILLSKNNTSRRRNGFLFYSKYISIKSKSKYRQKDMSFVGQNFQTETTHFNSAVRAQICYFALVCDKIINGWIQNSRHKCLRGSYKITCPTISKNSPPKTN